MCPLFRFELRISNPRVPIEENERIYRYVNIKKIYDGIMARGGRVWGGH